jgi:hypothetical protein
MEDTTRKLNLSALKIHGIDPESKQMDPLVSTEPLPLSSPLSDVPHQEITLVSDFSPASISPVIDTQEMLPASPIASLEIEKIDILNTPQGSFESNTPIIPITIEDTTPILPIA